MNLHDSGAQAVLRQHCYHDKNMEDKKNVAPGLFALDLFAIERISGTFYPSTQNGRKQIRCRIVPEITKSNLAKPEQRMNKLKSEQDGHVHRLVRRSILHVPRVGFDQHANLAFEFSLNLVQRHVSG